MRLEFSQGKYLIKSDDGSVVGEFATNAEAWRALDRMDGEPISRAEQTAEWIFRKD